MNPRINENEMDDVLGKAIVLLEEGKEMSEIISIFPEYEKELTDVFSTIKSISQAADHLMPRKEVLKDLLRRLPSEGVTASAFGRSLIPKEQKGRLSLSHSLTSYMMSMKNMWKVAIPFGVVAVFAIVVLSSSFQNRAEIAMEAGVAEEENFESLVSEIDGYLAIETSLQEVDDALSSEETIVSGNPDIEPLSTVGEKKSVDFEQEAMDAESKAINSDSELDLFFSEEENLREVDASLINS